MVGGFAAGAALAFAPLASADSPTHVISVVGSEESSLNALFAATPPSLVSASTDYSLVDRRLDTILTADIVKDAPLSGTPSILDYLLYGLNPFVARCLD